MSADLIRGTQSYEENNNIKQRYLYFLLCVLRHDENVLSLKTKKKQQVKKKMNPSRTDRIPIQLKNKKKTETEWCVLKYKREM